MMDFYHYMKLCGSCLVKEKAIIPIFVAKSTIKETFVNITTYLPIKVFHIDKFLKKNCINCLNKVNTLFQLWNTTINSKKQLEDRMNSFSSNNGFISTSLNDKLLKKECNSFKEEINLDSDESEDCSNATSDSCEEGEVIIKKPSKVEPFQFVDVSLDTNEAGPSGLQQDLFKMDGEIGATNQQGFPTRNSKNQDLADTETDSENKNSPEELIICQVCGKFFKTTFWFDKHMQSHVENKRFTCDLCGKSFKVNSVLRSHQREIHSAVKKFACQSCNYATNNKTNFESHVKIKHMDVNVHGIKCDHCDVKFFRVEDVMRHKIKEHNAPRFQCMICSKSYTSKQYLNIHKAIHKPNFKPEHQCVTCGKMFPNVGHLSSHIRSRHLGLRYDCKECGKSVSSRASLRDHMSIHTGIKPHVCGVCNKAFGARKYLRIHQRSHTGEKPYSCHQCDKSFTQRGSLTIHERYHSGDRPYQCLLCLKGFVAHSLLKSHMKSHKTNSIDLVN